MTTDRRPEGGKRNAESAAEPEAPDSTLDSAAHGGGGDRWSVGFATDEHR